MPTLAIVPNLGPMELIIILVVVVIIFGVGRLPEIGGALGKGIREFRTASKDDDDPKQLKSETKESPPASSERSEKSGTLRH